MAKPHTPMTTDVRAAYAAGEDSNFYTDEGYASRYRPTYAERAVGFDRWLEATIAVGRAQAFAEGKAEGIKAMATAVKADLKPEAEEIIGSADSAQGYKAGIIAAGSLWILLKRKPSRTSVFETINDAAASSSLRFYSLI